MAKKLKVSLSKEDLERREVNRYHYFSNFTTVKELYEKFPDGYFNVDYDSTTLVYKDLEDDKEYENRLDFERRIIDANIKKLLKLGMTLEEYEAKEAEKERLAKEAEKKRALVIAQKDLAYHLKKVAALKKKLGE